MVKHELLVQLIFCLGRSAIKPIYPSSDICLSKSIVTRGGEAASRAEVSGKDVLLSLIAFLVNETYCIEQERGFVYRGRRNRKLIKWRFSGVQMQLRIKLKG